VEVDDGNPAGAPSLVKRDIGKLETVGLTRNGTYYFTRRQDGLPLLSIVEMEQAGAKVRGGATHVAERFVGLGPTWSPDGKFLAFQTLRPSTNEYNRVVRSLETGEEKVYPRSGIVAGPARWLNDSSGFLETVKDEKGLQALYRVDLKTREFNQLMPFGPNPTTGTIGLLSPDNKTLYAGGLDPKNTSEQNRIVAYDLSTAQKRDVFTLPDGNNLSHFAISPDGQRLAIMQVEVKTKQAHIGFANIDGTNYRRLFSLPSSEVPRQGSWIYWTKDGKSILFKKLGNVSDSWQLTRVPADGGKPEFTGLEAGGLAWLDLNADGSRIAFSHKGQYSSELWALDNVLSVFKGVR